MPFGLFKRRDPASAADAQAGARTPDAASASTPAAEPEAAPLFPIRPAQGAIAEPPPLPPPAPPIQIRPPAPVPPPPVATVPPPALPQPALPQPALPQPVASPLIAPPLATPPPAAPQSAAPQSVASPPVTIGPRLPHGPGLDDLIADGRALGAVELHGALPLTRPDPFHTAPMIDGVSAFPDEFTDPARRVSVSGPVRLVALDDVVVLGRDGLCIWRDQLLAHSRQSVEPWRAESRIAHTDDAGALVLKQPVDDIVPVAGPLVMGFVGAWMNYAHWITECLPRAFAFMILRRREPTARLIVPDMPADGPQRETLRWLGIGPEQMVMLRDDQAIRAARLWCVGGVSVWHPPALVRIAALHLSAAIPLDLNEAEGVVASRVYIRRGMPTRQLTNFDELRPVLDRFGFNVLQMQDFGVQTQVRLMRNARLVIGENSGGLANVMFCRRGARLLELHNPVFAHPAHWALMGLAGGHYGYCLGRHVGDGSPDMNSDYAVPVEDFSRALEALVAG